ncbi:unnamed protein product [Anisakis simplex]|uniref:Uncharacterized protein n=1 Tax=Anisakis simplex TaxID=6269 RepID=A0A0M3JMD2_ANISI|nr:unnamed protein product [Anisakis simplex]
MRLIEWSNSLVKRKKRNLSKRDDDDGKRSPGLGDSRPCRSTENGNIDGSGGVNDNSNDLRNRSVGIRLSEFGPKWLNFSDRPSVECQH